MPNTFPGNFKGILDVGKAFGMNQAVKRFRERIAEVGIQILETGGFFRYQTKVRRFYIIPFAGGQKDAILA